MMIECSRRKIMDFACSILVFHCLWEGSLCHRDKSIYASRMSVYILCYLCACYWDVE